MTAQVPVKGTEEYYAALRAYKKTDHAVSFGWAGNSVVFRGSDANWVPGFEDLPDSMDIVSLWGDGGGFWVAPSPTKPEDAVRFAQMQSVRARKGTKFVACAWSYQIVNLMKDNFRSTYDRDVMAALDSAAKWIANYVNEYQLDGFDLDFEQDWGDPSILGDNRGRGVRPYTTDDPHMQRLFKSLSKYMGPLSGTDKILMIDGQFDLGIEPYINYLAQQAYNSSSASMLQGRFDNYGGGVLPSKKFIVTENMQANGARGVDYTVNGVNIGSVLGMATWNPTQGRKGGFGAYIIDVDAQPDATGQKYNYLRRGIQIQNPAAGGAMLTGVQFYQDANYGGAVTRTIPKGSYTMADFTGYGMVNDWASSVKIPAGWTVILYADNNFSGTSWTLTGDNANFGALSPSANDKVSSFKIQ
nr:glycoside hydrolase family 18 [uncultured Chitinophaga sp.]